MLHSKLLTIMGRRYPDMESRVLETVQREASGGAASMRQVVKAVKSSYERPPNKTTVWRVIKKLVDEGRLEARVEKVIREFTEYWLTASPNNIIDFDEESKRGEKLRIATQARAAVKEIKLPPVQLNPVEALSRRTEGELSALAETAKIGFEKLFTQSGERSYILRGR